MTTSIIILISLILLSAFFSGSETGLMALNRYRLRHLARRGNRSAQRAQRLLERPDRLLGVILIGNTFANIFAASLATVIAVHFVGDIGVGFATLALTFVVLIFAETAPKTLAAVNPERVAFFAVWPLGWLLILFYPVVWLVNTLANGLLWIFRVKVTHQRVEALSSEELRTMVHDSHGRIPRGYDDLLLSVLDMERMTVNDVMVPRNEIMGINLDDDWNEIVKQISDTTHNYLPVFQEDIDHVKGILHIREVLPFIAQGKFDKKRLLETIKPIYCVPEETPLQKQLVNFRQEKKRQAFIVDEYGNIQGLITLADIVEEIVGEFSDGPAFQVPEVYQQSDGSYLVSGSVNVRELNRLMGWELPEDGPKTLSGLIIEYLETIPNTATSLLLAGYPVEIVQVHSNRVKTARVFPNLRKMDY